MNLHSLLQQRLAAGRPVRVALIGAGKFGSMFLAQVPHSPGLEIAGIADLDPGKARQTLRGVGWSDDLIAATPITEDAAALVAGGDVEVVVEATGHPAVGLRHARAAIGQGKHVVMVTVEADVLAGPLLAREAAAAGVVYSLAYGDQPAMICELVDWARACGFAVMSAGRGVNYLPHYHASTPETVWEIFYSGLSAEQAAAGGMNPQMFNSFIDGTKPSIESAAVVNATGLAAPSDGLAFPPCGVDDLARVLRPRSAGGALERAGQVEVVASLERDGRPVFRDLRWGIYVAIEAPNPYSARCFAEYGLITDPGGTVAALYKPYHLIGLELNVSILSAALRGEATGSPRGFLADVVATAKRDLEVGETLDGEGGYCVWGKLWPAERSLAEGALPIGLAQGLRLRQPVAEGAVLTWEDVEIDPSEAAYRLRREMEATCGPAAA